MRWWDDYFRMWGGERHETIAYLRGLFMAHGGYTPNSPAFVGGKQV